MPWGLVQPVLDRKMVGLCRLPYDQHKQGCPNWGKHSTCPPQAPWLAEILDLAQPVYAIWTTFDLAAHVAKMQEAHPGWTDRQLHNCLYWQGSARKTLRQEAATFLAAHPADPWTLLYRPEACGLVVGATMQQLGVTLEWMPRSIVHLVVLAGLGRKVSEYSLLGGVK